MTDGDGKVTEIHCTYDPETKSGSGFNARKVKGTIHWVSAAHAVKVTARLYENLVDEEKGVYNEEDGSMNLNPNSVTVMENCYVEPAVKGRHIVRAGHKICIHQADFIARIKSEIFRDA